MQAFPAMCTQAFVCAGAAASSRSDVIGKSSFTCRLRAASVAQKPNGTMGPSMLIGIVYSTTTGNTSDVAQQIKDVLGSEASDPVEIDDAKDGFWSDHDAILAGAPTWNTGADEMRSGTTWDDFLYAELLKMDFKGRSIGIFGCGDSVAYGDNFVDAIEEMHDCFDKQGAKMIGYVDASEYQHEESKAERDGKFLGLAIDNDNEDDLTDDRVAKWCKQILAEV